MFYSKIQIPLFQLNNIKQQLDIYHLKTISILLPCATVIRLYDYQELCEYEGLQVSGFLS